MFSPVAGKIGPSPNAVGGRVRELVTRLTQQSYTPLKSKQALWGLFVDKVLDTLLKNADGLLCGYLSGNKRVSPVDGASYLSR